jgi:hypothetical protein
MTVSPGVGGKPVRFASFKVHLLAAPMRVERKESNNVAMKDMPSPNKIEEVKRMSDSVKPNIVTKASGPVALAFTGGGPISGDCVLTLDCV